MYKDKEKQKEANRLANKKYRDKLKGITQESITEPGITPDPRLQKTYSESAMAVGLPADPLKLYSAERWEGLQAKGYEMPDSAYYDGQLNLEGEIPEAAFEGYARKVVSVWYDGEDQAHHIYAWAPPLPGDPAYVSEPGICGTCEAETQIKSITKCHKCVEVA